MPGGMSCIGMHRDNQQSDQVHGDKNKLMKGPNQDKIRSTTKWPGGAVKMRKVLLIIYLGDQLCCVRMAELERN